MTPEKKVKNAIVKILKEHDCYHCYPSTHGYGTSGIPDIIACYKGVFLGIEAKADARKNKPTALQIRNLKQIASTGGLAMVVDKHTVNDVRVALAAIDNDKEAAAIMLRLGINNEIYRDIYSA